MNNLPVPVLAENAPIDAKAEGYSEQARGSTIPDLTGIKDREITNSRGGQLIS